MERSVASPRCWGCCRRVRSSNTHCQAPVLSLAPSMDVRWLHYSCSPVERGRRGRSCRHIFLLLSCEMAGQVINYSC